MGPDNGRVAVWRGTDVIYLDDDQAEFLFNELLTHYDKVAEEA